MFQVLVVEDESPILRNICKMVEMVNPLFHVKYRARNGAEALKILEDASDIDFMMLDINTPIMNGLELMEELRLRNIQVKIVILSGFHEFEYIRTAMRNGAIDYLTKPLKKEELLRVLSRVEELLLVENYQRNKRRIKEMEKESLEGDYEIASVIFGGTINVEEATNLYQIIEVEDILMKYLEKKYTQDEYWIINKSYNERIIMFKKNQIKNQMIWRNMDEIFREARVAVTMVLYQFPQTHKTIHVTDNKLSAIVRDLMNVNKHVFYYGDGYEIAENNFAEIKKIKEQYKYAQYQSQIGEGLQKIIINSSGNRSVLLEVLKMYIMYYLEKFTIQYSYTEMESRIRYCVLSAESLEQLCEEIQSLNIEYFLSQEEKEQSKSHMARNIKKYIDNSFSTNITNVVLEEKYGFVASYIRQIFQQEYDITPMEYLQKIRIDQSKILIKDGKEQSFKSIAQAVGFNDSMYFSKVFRKMVGMTPSEYKVSIMDKSFE